MLAIYVTTCRRTLWGGIVVGCVLRRNPRQHRSCPLGSLYAKWVVVPHPLIRYIMGECCVVAVVSKKAEWGQEETIPTECELTHRLMMVVAVVLRLPQDPTPGF